MDLFYAICQGLGLALAAGLGGLLAPLLASVLAHVDIGWKLDGTSWEFVASEWFIAVLFGLNLAGYVFRSRRLAQPALLGALVVLGALLFASSLAEEGASAWPGLIAGAAAALFAALIARDVLAAAARRSSAADPASASTEDASIGLLAAAAGLILVLASLFIPPASIVVLAGLLALAAARRRQADRKHEGLRVLR